MCSAVFGLSVPRITRESFIGDVFVLHFPCAHAPLCRWLGLDLVKKIPKCALAAQGDFWGMGDLVGMLR